MRSRELRSPVARLFGMTLQEFKDGAAKIFPNANVGGVTKDRWNPAADLLVGLVELSDPANVSFDALVELSSFTESRKISISSEIDHVSSDSFETLTRVKVRVQL